MKKLCKRSLAMLLAIALSFLAIPNSLGKMSKVEAASDDIYNINNLINYDLGKKSGKTSINSGSILVPEKEGTYPVLFVVHGSGGKRSDFHSSMAQIMNNAVKKGYIEPMVVVMPTIPHIKDPSWGTVDFGEYTSTGLCLDLVNAIKSGNLGKYVTSGTWNSSVAGRIDGNAPMSITGYSMGGSVSLHVGCNSDLRGTFINVGACSPSYCFFHRDWDYKQNKFVIYDDSYVADPQAMIYSDDPKGHFWMSYGKAEDSTFANNAAQIRYAFEQTENIKKFKMLDYNNAFDAAYRGHAMPLFYAEMFSFLYYVKNEEVPTAGIIRSACGSNVVQITNDEGIEGVVSISGSNKVGETLTANVSKCNASSVSYQWRRGKENISGATSSSYKLTNEDIGKKISCKITDNSGKYTGFVSGYVYGGEGSDTVVPDEDKDTVVPEADSEITVETVTKSLTVNHKEPYRLEVKATGSNLNYEWQYRVSKDVSWTKSDFTNNSAILDMPSATRDVHYRCVVSNGKETKYSDDIEVFVKPIITSVTSSLSDGKVKEGEEYTVSVTVSGQDLEYQWESSTDNKNWKKVSGATSSTLKGIGDKNIYYHCKVTSGSQTVVSDSVSVEVEIENVPQNDVPVIESVTPSVSNNTVDMGQNYSITVNATGSNLSYQWMWRTDKTDWAASKCPGNNEATIQLEGKRPVVYYKCVVSNGAGSVESEEIAISLVNPVLTTSLSNNTVKNGQAYTISTSVKNSKFRYSWEYDKHDGNGWLVSQVPGCTTDTLNLTGKNPVITYRCTITFNDGSNEFSVTSDEITITMAE